MRRSWKAICTARTKAVDGEKNCMEMPMIASSSGKIERVANKPVRTRGDEPARLRHHAERAAEPHQGDDRCRAVEQHNQGRGHLRRHSRLKLPIRFNLDDASKYVERQGAVAPNNSPGLTSYVARLERPGMGVDPHNPVSFAGPRLSELSSAKVRFAQDSSLEEAVTSEPVT
jgi:hypothetical protein